MVVYRQRKRVTLWNASIRQRCLHCRVWRSSMPCLIRGSRRCLVRRLSTVRTLGVRRRTAMVRIRSLKISPVSRNARSFVTCKSQTCLTKFILAMFQQVFLVFGAFISDSLTLLFFQLWCLMMFDSMIRWRFDRFKSLPTMLRTVSCLRSAGSIRAISRSAHGLNRISILRRRPRSRPTRWRMAICCSSGSTIRCVDRRNGTIQHCSFITTSMVVFTIMFHHHCKFFLIVFL